VLLPTPLALLPLVLALLLTFLSLLLALLLALLLEFLAALLSLLLLLALVVAHAILLLLLLLGVVDSCALGVASVPGEQTGLTPPKRDSRAVLAYPGGLFALIHPSAWKTNSRKFDSYAPPGSSIRPSRRAT
jgi:hypothetical protein